MTLKSMHQRVKQLTSLLLHVSKFQIWDLRTGGPGSAGSGVKLRKSIEHD